MIRKFVWTVSLVILCEVGRNTPIQAAFVNLSTVGAAHAQSDGNWANFRAFATVPNAVGNWAFAGAWALAAGPPGIAFGAGAGYAASPAPNALFLEAQVAVALIPGLGPGILNAWGVGFADPAPNPFLNPLSDSQLNGIFGDHQPIKPGPPLTQSQFDNTLNDHPVTNSSPGVDGDASLTVTLDPSTNQLAFDFSGNMMLETDDLSTYSVSLSLDSPELGLHRSFTFDESGQFKYPGGKLGTPSETQNGSEIDLNLAPLSFTMSVPQGYDLQTSDFTMEAIGTASATTPEPSTLTLLGTGLIGLLGYGWRRRKRIA